MHMGRNNRDPIKFIYITLVDEEIYSLVVIR